MMLNSVLFSLRFRLPVQRPFMPMATLRRPVSWPNSWQRSCWPFPQTSWQRPPLSPLSKVEWFKLSLAKQLHFVYGFNGF
ncbi:hypothetical protein DPMN_035428 [Dreissena polymorpha]|uniref:Uncharacterized protein n=1 Tax=Dreissena polymorpha TaxID=45954 RepID=A0A9D4M8R8_DREPO|nr:hypothetical protein DPMN_035428 [Dreissena polymorpha]